MKPAGNEVVVGGWELRSRPCAGGSMTLCHTPPHRRTPTSFDLDISSSNDDINTGCLYTSRLTRQQYRDSERPKGSGAGDADSDCDGLRRKEAKLERILDIF